ncbi:MAG: ammonium transporter [Leptospiraceae bacterium]|nr:ammonium transporter [Leptospiraceae bacterium]
MKIRKLSLFLSAMILSVSFAGSLQAQDKPKEAPKPKELTIEQRVADIEAYMNNTPRVKDDAAVKPEAKAEKTNIAGAGPGHNAWIMTSALLVLFMTLPGLALFYGGLVRTKNVLSVVAQCFGIAGLVTILWWAIGYSFAFSEGSPFLGGTAFALFKGVDSAVGQGGQWISNNVFSMFQMMFAIITPALIVGAIAERMKFSSVLLFVALWMFAVYFPLAHMVWGPGGFMNGLGNFEKSGIKAIDFAGGTVVHMSSGWSALILCLIVGKRSGFGAKSFAPHSMVLTAIGTGMLWVGWYGFNAGSALAADGIAANAFTTTTLAAAVAAFVWPVLEWILKGHPTVLGFCSGAVSGLVVITPAAGFVTPGSAVIMGLLAGAIPFFAVMYMKKWLGYDDALDTFGVHGVGGTLGAILTAVFASTEANPALADVIKKGLMGEHFKAIAFTIVLSVVATVVIALLLKFTIGLKASAETESLGLDISEHGEEGYNGFQTFVE